MINRLNRINYTNKIEFFVFLYTVSSNYIAVCPKLDIFVHSRNRSQTLKELSKNILNYFDINNVEIVDYFKNSIMSKCKMKFIAKR